MNPIYGLVPAAGVGARMQADRPKQYLPLGSRTLLERAVDCLLADARVARVVVVVAPGDEFAQHLALPPRCELLAAGGASRAQTVCNGLEHLVPLVGGDAGILVHDAARPCLAPQELAALIGEGAPDEHGALLALPVADTLKRGIDGRVAATVERDGLWRALTPQYFRAGALLAALRSALAQGSVVTDEASAAQMAGLRPRLVEGLATNVKVTAPGDLALAEAILRCQGRW